MILNLEDSRLGCECFCHIFLNIPKFFLSGITAESFFHIFACQSAAWLYNTAKHHSTFFCISRLLLWIKGILKRSSCGKVKKKTLQWFGIPEQRISLPNRIQFTGDKESVDSDFSCSEFSSNLAKSSWDKSVLPPKRLCCHTVEKIFILF